MSKLALAVLFGWIALAWLAVIAVLVRARRAERAERAASKAYMETRRRGSRAGK